MSQSGWRSIVLLLAATICACSPPETTAPAIGETTLLRFGLHTVESFDVAVDGKHLHLLAAGKTKPAGMTVLRHALSTDAGQSFGEPVAVGTEQPAPLNPGRGRDVEIAVSGDDLIAVWNTNGAGYMGSGPMVTALSSDGGRTFRPGPNPADDGRVDGHSFYELAADNEGRFHLVWLDSRSGHQGLHYAQSSTSGADWSRNKTLDDVSCECCWNRLHADSSGAVFALYRDKEPRDMALMASADAGQHWQTRSTVGRFDWQFDGCPHSGGALAQTGSDEAPMLHALVWTGKEGKTGLWTMRSEDQGASWDAPQRLGGAYARHADLASNGERLIAVWDATGAQGEHSIEMAYSDDRGKSFSTPVTLRASNLLLSHPRVVVADDIFLVLWTEAESEHQKSVGLLRIAAQ